MVARMVWDHEVAGSRPVTPTILRVSYIGNTSAFQAEKVGPIPTTRSIKIVVSQIKALTNVEKYLKMKLVVNICVFSSAG